MTPEAAITGGQSPDRFVTTRWSVVLSCADSKASTQTVRDALAQLCQTYWRPIFAFVCRSGHSIEDAQDLREVFTLLLRAEGADVASAANRRDATDLFAAQRFDVVLSDLGLPDIPGDVLIRELRARSARATRVVVVTGYGEPFLARARQAGADVVFTKPVEWSRILEYLEHPDFAASA